MSPLFVPGPVDILPDVQASLGRPMMFHRGAEFEALYHKLEQASRCLYDTQRHVYIASFSGTGMMEAAMRNFVEKDVLICVSGGFSDRWYAIAQNNGKQADLFNIPPGDALLPELIAPLLTKKHYEAIAIVHNETSTGVENPVEEIAQMVHIESPDTLILLDCVSSIGGAYIGFDRWGIDFAFGSVNKCLAMPPGLSVAVASERALEKAASVANRGWFLDILRLDHHHHINTVPTTPAVSLYFAYETQLRHILSEGLPQRFARHQAMAERVSAWGESHGMPPLAKPPFRSKTMTALHNDHQLDFQSLRAYLKQFDLEIANGYDELKDHTFRIANMGELHLADVDRLLTQMEIYIRESTN
ncbi:MAG: alanine--glyoxylate aminotransferase family protein [Anaerolineae bacterium]|nr:alanine--glyoxylate aminotransferase family protein [Anaerolineae bacterium]